MGMKLAEGVADIVLGVAQNKAAMGILTVFGLGVRTMVDAGRVAVDIASESTAKLMSILRVTNPFEAVSQGFEAAIDHQLLESQFARMLNNLEQAKVITEDILAMSLRSPWEVGELAKVEKMLINIGVAVRDVGDYMDVFSDIAAGANIPIEDLAKQFEFIAKRGKTGPGDLQMFADQGIYLTRILGQMRGESDETVRAMADRGRIKPNEIMAALQTTTQPGGQFEGAATAAMGTLAGQVNQLKKDVQETLRVLMQGWLPVIQQILEKIRTWSYFLEMSFRGAQDGAIAWGALWGHLANIIFTALSEAMLNFFAWANRALAIWMWDNLSMFRLFGIKLGTMLDKVMPNMAPGYAGTAQAVNDWQKLIDKQLKEAADKATRNRERAEAEGGPRAGIDSERFMSKQSMGTVTDPRAFGNAIQDALLQGTYQIKQLDHLAAIRQHAETTAKNTTPPGMTQENQAREAAKAKEPDYSTFWAMSGLGQFG